MRRAANALTAVAALTLCLSAWAQGAFFLDEVTFKAEEKNPFPALALSPEKEKGLPDELPGSVDEIQAAAFTVRVGGERIVFVIEAARNPRLYIDLDNDGSLADERAIPSHREENWQQRFGPITVPVPGSTGQLSVRFCVTALVTEGGVYSVVAFPARCREGTVRLGGVEYKIALADADNNGRYDGACASFDGDYSAINGDCIAIDLDRNGRFDPLIETCPLSKMIRVRNVCYELVVAPDGSRIQLRAVQPEFQLGVLDTGCPDAQFVLFSPELGLICLGGGLGKWRLPEGEYTVMESRLMRRDESNATWLLKRKWRAAKRPTYAIPAGDTLTVQLGSPLRAEVKVSYNAERGSASVSFSLTGAGGEEYIDAAERNGRKADAPDLKIVDERGSTLESGTFRYG